MVPPLLIPLLLLPVQQVHPVTTVHRVVSFLSMNSKGSTCTVNDRHEQVWRMLHLQRAVYNGQPGCWSNGFYGLMLATIRAYVLTACQSKTAGDTHVPGQQVYHPCETDQVPHIHTHGVAVMQSL